MQSYAKLRYVGSYKLFLSFCESNATKMQILRYSHSWLIAAANAKQISLGCDILGIYYCRASRSFVKSRKQAWMKPTMDFLRWDTCHLLFIFQIYFHSVVLRATMYFVPTAFSVRDSERERKRDLEWERARFRDHRNHQIYCKLWRMSKHLINQFVSCID